MKDLLRMSHTHTATISFCFVFAEEAKANAPCVIFIDELDSVGGKRIESPMHPYSRQTINQLLAEMDGSVSLHIPELHDVNFFSPARTEMSLLCMS